MPDPLPVEHLFLRLHIVNKFGIMRIRPKTEKTDADGTSSPIETLLEGV